MLQSVGRMRRATMTVAAVVAAGAALTASAQGATTTYPAAGGGFDAGAEGWTASGQSCGQLSGIALLCDTTTAHQPTGGNPGGALGTTNTVTLNVLGLFQGSSLWTSPAFTIPAGAQVTGASVALDQALVDNGAFGLDPSSTVNVTLADLTTTATTNLVTTPLGTSNSSFQAASVGIPDGKVVAGHSYELRITTTTASATAAGLLGSVTTLLDNVRMTVTTQDPVIGGPNPPGTPVPTPIPPGPGGPTDTPTVTPGSRVLRGPYSNSEIASVMSSLNLNAESGTLAGGSLVPADKCTVVGTPGADKLTGTTGHDVICGLGGNDTINGGGGRDVLDGGDGNDRLGGGGAGDIALGLRGGDRLTGGAGDDGLGGGSGNDRENGGAGKDRVFGRSGNDRLTGGRGADRLEGGAGKDRFSARDGARDVVKGGAGRDSARADRASRGRKGTRGLRVVDRVSGVERVR